MSQELIQEIWKDILDYEGLYQVSNLGRVKSLRFKKEKILKQQKNNYKYLQVNFCKNNNHKTHRTHQLVMLSFKLDKKFDYSEINHIDGNKENNTIDNLEWCTHKENMQHAIENNLSNKGEKNGMSKLNEQQIRIIRLSYKNKYFNQTELSKIFNVKSNTISNIINYKQWNHI